MSVGLAVLVPLRPFGTGKTRLSGLLSPTERARWVERWAVRALESVRGATHAPVALVAPEALADFAHAHACERIDDAAFPGLVPAVTHGLDVLTARGHERALVLMPDLPDATPDDVAACLRADADVVVARSANGLGTNALVLPLPQPFPLAFGDPESGLLHAARAAGAGLRVVSLGLASLARDVDLEADLRPSEVQELASRSRTFERGS